MELIADFEHLPLKKMSPPKDLASSTPAPDLDILGDRVTLHPGGYLAPNQNHENGQDRNLVEHMARFRQNPLDFFREVSLHVSGHGWRAYDHVIGQPVFYSGFSEKMKSDIMQTPMLRRKIEDLACRRVRLEQDEGLLEAEGSAEGGQEKRKLQIEETLREVALEMTDAMICKMESRTFIRGAYYICTQLLTRAYHQGIHVSSEEVLRLRSVAEAAAEQKRSIVFLPCHRSHVDYVSLQLICYRLGIALPTVVAGDNLNIPLIGSFLQHAGAMWIKRSFGDNPLYSTLVQSYIDTLLQRGFNFECFIEGGRSRTGKLLSPKFGILSFLLDSVLSGRVEDAIICPVSTQYDKVIETESYINELLGQPKPKETLQDLLSASTVLSLRLGRVDVRFSEPWSLKNFITEQKARSRGTELDASNHGRDRIRMLRTLGFKVLSDINAVSVVMPTALVGTVLLTLRGRGVGKNELIRRVEWLSNRVRDKGGRVAHFAGTSTEVVVDRALEVLGSAMVGTVPGLPEQTYYAVDRFQLSFYRNMTIHLFVAEALVSVAMYTKVKEGGGPENQSITFDEMYGQVLFLSGVFRGEFIYSTSGLMQNLQEALYGLEKDGVISLRRAAAGNITAIELSRREREMGRENFDFYCFLIWPFIESAWLASISLMGLTPQKHSQDAEEEIFLDLLKVQDAAQLLGKTLYHQGDLSYFESVNKENLRNAFQLFEEEGILEVRRAGKDRKISASVKLAREWTPERASTTQDIIPTGKLWTFIEKVARPRREGKNRRDGATVRLRVLRLADQLGRELFASAKTNASIEADSVHTDASATRRRKEEGSELKPRL